MSSSRVIFFFFNALLNYLWLFSTFYHSRHYSSLAVNFIHCSGCYIQRVLDLFLAHASNVALTSLSLMFHFYKLKRENNNSSVCLLSSSKD